VVSSVLKAVPETTDWSGARRAFAAWLALAVAVAALKFVGFFVAFAALAFFMMAVMYRRPFGNAAIVAACVTAGFYLVFPLALGVKLP
jgi:hypothetical protein